MEKEIEKQTIKELQKVAKDNGFYLMPVGLYAEVCNTIEVLRLDRDALRVRRDDLKSQLRDLKKTRSKQEANNG